MKKIIRTYLMMSVSLYLISRLTEGINLEKGFESLFLAGAGLTVGQLIVRPLINLLLLPLNLVTFGLFRWISSAITLYLATLVVPGFTITNFFFAGFSTQWFTLPAFDLAGVFAYVAFSFILSFIFGILFWLIKL